MTEAASSRVRLHTAPLLTLVPEAEPELISILLACTTLDEPRAQALIEQLSIPAIEWTLITGIEKPSIQIPEPDDDHPSVAVICVSDHLTLPRLQSLLTKVPFQRRPSQRLVVERLDVSNTLSDAIRATIRGLRAQHDMVLKTVDERDQSSVRGDRTIAEEQELPPPRQIPVIVATPSHDIVGPVPPHERGEEPWCSQALMQAIKCDEPAANGSSQLKILAAEVHDRSPAPVLTVTEIHKAVTDPHSHRLLVITLVAATIAGFAWAWLQPVTHEPHIVQSITDSLDVTAQSASLSVALPNALVSPPTIEDQLPSALQQALSDETLIRTHNVFLASGPEHRVTWKQAALHCQRLQLANLHAWRLPTRSEVQSMLQQDAPIEYPVWTRSLVPRADVPSNWVYLPQRRHFVRASKQAEYFALCVHDLSPG